MDGICDRCRQDRCDLLRKHIGKQYDFVNRLGNANLCYKCRDDLGA